MADSQEKDMTGISSQPNLQIVVQGSGNTNTRTPHVRNSPCLKQENTQRQETHEDPTNPLEDRAGPIKQENTQPKAVHGPQDDISPE